MNLSEKRLLTYEEAAHYLSLSVTAFRRHVAPHLTKIHPTGHGSGRVAWDRAEIDRWVDAKTGCAPVGLDRNPLDQILGHA